MGGCFRSKYDIDYLYKKKYDIDTELGVDGVNGSLGIDIVIAHFILLAFKSLDILSYQVSILLQNMQCTLW